MPLPIRTSAGFCEIGLSGKMRMKMRPPRLMCRLIARRAMPAPVPPHILRQRRIAALGIALVALLMVVVLAVFCRPGLQDFFRWSIGALRDAIKGGMQRGGSTISQQVVKNVFLWQGRSWLRKAIEATLTPPVELVWNKRRILEVYLNVVEWGNGLFGAEAAARRYYGVSAAQLGPGQSARLAVMLPNPRRYEHNYGPRLAAHADRIQRRMAASQVP